jgi:hypothetical protein
MANLSELLSSIWSIRIAFKAAIQAAKNNAQTVPQSE